MSHIVHIPIASACGQRQQLLQNLQVRHLAAQHIDLRAAAAFYSLADVSAGEQHMHRTHDVHEVARASFECTAETYKP